MRDPLRTVRAAATFAVAVALCGCGGGGGGSAPGAPSPPAIPDRTAARADAQAVLAVGKILGQRGLIANATPIGIFSTARRPAASRSAQAVPCSPGPSGSGGTTTVTTPTVGGVSTRTVTDYYDAACTQPELISAITIFGPAPTGVTTHGQGTVTAYDRSGAVIMYSQVTTDSDPSSVTAQADDAIHPDGSGTTGLTSMTCTTAQAGVSQRCTLASWSRAGLATFGVTGTIVLGSAPNGSLTRTTAQITLANYTGLPDIAYSAQTGWTFNNGTQLSTVTGTAFVDGTNGSMSDSNYDANDPVTGVAVHATVVGPGIAFTVSRGGAAIATVSADADGIGTIRYADGTSEPIAGFSIFG